jgi:hypothetical protein
LCECPSSDLLNCVHSQRCCHRLQPTRINWSVPFRPRGFAPPRRLTPQKSPGLVASRYRKGFAAFQHRSLHSPPDSPKRASSRLVDHSHSRCALHTPRRSPPDCSRVASLRPLPPRRCASTFLPSKLGSPVTTLDLVALLHCLVRSLQQPLPVADGPLLPGLCSPTGFWLTR